MAVGLACATYFAWASMTFVLGLVCLHMILNVAIIACTALFVSKY
ncbi:predicted protein [Sclerotinia sclerotiorum 1980 UF-70]|uniref:Uncharacterized protein n=1 Tax=Sclerotinia sclerotiorum (strain ATCC 18683 / 1980 / Ss-1) TaxID=665079 RepID=A7EF16_SCLS1|nr:predicted protein [Sclerotinia sclerotiorum 1980 UF-70]EDO01432.1 predicted protein [Sclerotinia sclerotiorum 1980 UF-70]